MEINLKERFLPVGTVVLLRGGKKRVMVTGFCVVSPEIDKKVFDYCGCVYPEGYLDSKQNCLFDHTQIDKIYHVGLVDDEEIKFKTQLKEFAPKIDETFADLVKTTNQVALEVAKNELEEVQQPAAPASEEIREAETLAVQPENPAENVAPQPVATEAVAAEALDAPAPVMPEAPAVEVSPVAPQAPVQQVVSQQPAAPAEPSVINFLDDNQAQNPNQG